MPRYINADRARETATIDLIVHHLDRQPTADVVPVVHGRWLDGRCTNCAYEAPDFISYVGYELDDWEPTPYCPNCGARMDGDTND